MRPILILSFLLAGIESTSAANDKFFDSQVAPILVHHCIECHNANDFKGKLDLQAHEGFLAGGELGKAFDKD